MYRKNRSKLWLFAIVAVIVAIFGFIFMNENYSNGERIGTITQFSKNGQIFKTHEGHLNVTQTGMNSSTGFDFSIDGSNEPENIIAILDSAANNGWKVKLIYHEVRNKNWFSYRGNTNFFVTDVKILDKNFDDPFGNKTGGSVGNGRVIDTIYVVITPGDPNFSKFFERKVQPVAAVPTIMPDSLVEAPKKK